MNKIAKRAALLLAGAALTLLGVAAMAFAQTTATPSLADHATTYLCSNNGAVLRYVLEWGGGVIGGASLLGNFRSKLPAPLVKVADALTLDFASAFKAKVETPSPQKPKA